MTARSSFSDRLHLVEVAQERTEREHTRTLEELRRTTEQTEALMSDKRSSDRVLRDTERAVLALDRRVTSLAVHHRESLSVMRDMADEMRAQRAALEALGARLASTRTAATEAKTKASGAHKLGLELERRMSQAEQRDLEFARDIGVAMAEGQELADKRDARKRLVATLTSVPVVLAILGLLARCSGGP